MILPHWENMPNRLFEISNGLFGNKKSRFENPNRLFENKKGLFENLNRLFENTPGVFKISPGVFLSLSLIISLSSVFPAYGAHACDADAPVVLRRADA